MCRRDDLSAASYQNFSDYSGYWIVSCGACCGAGANRRRRILFATRKIDAAGLDREAAALVEARKDTRRSVRVTRPPATGKASIPSAVRRRAASG